MSHSGDCSKGLAGPIADWDVSAVIDMGNMFVRASKFNQDLSKWDVSTVRNMAKMFLDASAFNHELCGDAWEQSGADKSDMFEGSSGSILLGMCTTIKHGYGGDYG